ncbi:cysteine desulfurase family protein [Sutcliffiella cohnii]|uniref:Cysteine desulfurase NifS n=1 Tax=Sutcliffiella cohnii TaxID=33932 RepID=A0A223KTN8_9BACI|nr:MULTISPECIES: cysteine desulfurase family protein [Sutcliffiella]AST92861.1 cysteine desulfurase NifS [Sutcliffiella cohnii]MED4016184.1 cysteine desulfurase family protein [Sutcliffiella cohnii]WBL14119.1 cysteine desulfurase family protein [Sutcliffiella sp. NC1]
MIYLDNSATTKPYEEVLQSYIKVADDYFSNPSSLHRFGGDAEKLLQQARESVAKLLNVHSKEIIFTSGGTEGNNIAIKGTALRNEQRGRHIVTTEIEHPSVSEACQQLEQLGFEITYLPVTEDGLVSLDVLKESLRPDTILVSIIHVNNETGVVQPVEEIGKIIKAHSSAIYHVDHVQGITKVPLNFKNSYIDLCTMSAHKFHGLKGNGILYIKQGTKLSPLFGGGNQELTLRSGTENVAGIVSMAKALRLSLEKFKLESNKLMEIKTYLINNLLTVPDVIVNTPTKSAPHIVNFSVPGIKAEVLIHSLGKENIFVSTTSACSSKRKAPSKTLIAMGKPKEEAETALRVSLSYSNTMEEAKLFLEVLTKSIKQIQQVTRL